MENVDHLRNAYSFKDHLISFKEKIEKMFEIKITWDSFDQIYKQLQNISSQTVHEKYTIEQIAEINTFEKYVDYSLECRTELMKLVGEEFTEELKESFKYAFLNCESNKLTWVSSIHNIIINKHLKDMKDE